MQPKYPNEIPGVRKSSRVKFQTKQYYIPSSTGYKYAVAVDQLEDNRVLHLDAHMLFMQIEEEHPDVIKAIMTPLSLKAGLK